MNCTLYSLQLLHLEVYFCVLFMKKCNEIRATSFISLNKRKVLGEKGTQVPDTAENT